VVGRIFAAVPLAPDARLGLAGALDGIALPGRLSPPDNWHITLRFLGRIDEATYERFLNSLEPVSTRRRFRIRLEGLGAFPNEKRATVVWVGVDQGGDKLADLADCAEDAAVSAGLESEERPYRPHLTIARVRPPADVRHLLDVPVSVGWLCDRVTVYRSMSGRGGTRYEPLETFPLLR
jgi:RNA 2',3'-cyclic 3'-phosphodiesterase